MANEFCGTAYWYWTPEGTKPIGVVQGLGDVWIVAYYTRTGARRRIKSPALEPRQTAEAMQAALEIWATAKGLSRMRQ